MGSILSSSGRSGEFFFDVRTDQWRWWWGGQLWTFQPLYDDDFDVGILRTGGCWVSDYTGQCWYGVNPDDWMRGHRWRMERRRRWRAGVVQCRLARQALQQKMPGSLTQLILEQAFPWHAAQKK